MESKRKHFFLLLFALAVFTMGAVLFSDNDDMVFEPQEETEKTETGTNLKAASSPAAADNDFFADFRVHREQRRDEAEELYRGILDDPARDEAARSEAESALKQLYYVSSLEDQVEEILVGRNYRDVVFVMGENLSLLMMKDSELSAEEKESLSTFVCSYAGIDVSTLSVFSVD